MKPDDGDAYVFVHIRPSRRRATEGGTAPLRAQDW
nr:MULTISPECIES: hypothetical protein [unclassified Bradyrhizobium]